jgi:hypothetical protein
MANTKLSAFFSLLLVFFSGAVVGVFGYRVYNTSAVVSQRPPEKKQDPGVRRKQLIDEDTRELKLDADQVEKLGKVYDGTLEQFLELHKKMNAESRTIWENQIASIKSFLRPDQVVLYDSLRAKREAAHEANDRKQGRRKGGPPPDKKD